MEDKAYIVQNAQEYAKKGKIDKAIAQWSKLLNVSQDGQIYNTIGDLYIKKGSHEEAVDFFTKAASIFKKHGFYSKATGIYNKILTFEPDNLDIVVALSRVNAERGFPGKAVENFIDASEKIMEDGDEEKALEVLEKALSIFPNDIDIEKQIKEVTNTIEINEKIWKSEESKKKLFRWGKARKSKKAPVKSKKEKREPLSLLIRGAVFIFVVAAVLAITFESSYRESIILMPGTGSSMVEDFDKQPLTASRRNNSSVSDMPEETPLLPKEENDDEIINEIPEEEKINSEPVALAAVEAEPESGMIEFNRNPLLIYERPLETVTLGADIQIKGLGEYIPLNDEIEYEPEVVSEGHTVEENIVQESTAEERKNISTPAPALMVPYTSDPSVVYEEQFNDNTNNWSTFETMMAAAFIEEGKYYIDNKREFGRHMVLFNYFFSHKLDFSLEVSINKEGGPENSAYGLVFAVRNAQNNLVFQIMGNNNYSIGKYINGDFQEVAGGRIGDTYIKKESANVLKLVKQGNDMHFFINDNYLNKVSGLPLYGKKIGFIVDGKTKISIDDILLQVWNHKKVKSIREGMEDSSEESLEAVLLPVPTKGDDKTDTEVEQGSYFNRTVLEIRKSKDAVLDKPEIRKRKNVVSDKWGRGTIIK